MRRTTIVLLALAGLLAAAVLAGCGGGEEAAPTAETVEGTLPADTAAETTGDTTGDTTSETTGDTTGETTGDTGEGGAGGGDADAGSEVFASAGCGGCHVLADAGSSGNIGPNLDEAQPDFEYVVTTVTNGRGAMPAFKDQLSEGDIQNVAAYVSSVAGS